MVGPRASESSAKIVHLITGLPVGGAQTVLYQLLEQIGSDPYRSEVISLTEVGAIGDRIRTKLNIPVRALNVSKKLPNPLRITKLVSWLRHTRPDLVQTWMYHADLVGGIATKLGCGAPILWNIRQSNLDPVSSKRTTILTAQACARLSRIIPKTIVCCSEASRDIHAKMGYDAKRMVIIRNGVDSATFKPDPAARKRIRTESNIPETARVIGLVARWDPQKDHHTFIAGAAKLGNKLSDTYFLLCGEGITTKNRELMGWIAETGIENRFRLLGQRNDMAAVTAALDFAASTSRYGEGFPNTVAEAMACGVPCVVTDVGDSALIVGDLGEVVISKDPTAFATAVAKLAEGTRSKSSDLSTRTRLRMIDHFSIETATSAYRQLYEESLAGARHRIRTNSRQR